MQARNQADEHMIRRPVYSLWFGLQGSRFKMVVMVMMVIMMMMMIFGHNDDISIQPGFYPT